MSNDIEKHRNQLDRTWNGKRVRTAKNELLEALAPMFVAFPNLEMSDETFNAYYLMLCDLDADKLAVAVLNACQAHEYPTQLITVAAIRKAYESEQRAPGPRSEKALTELPSVPARMFRLDAEDDRRERMERLKRTEKWSRYYA
jgi:hypothetical protein